MCECFGHYHGSICGSVWEVSRRSPLFTVPPLVPPEATNKFGEVAARSYISSKTPAIPFPKRACDDASIHPTLLRPNNPPSKRPPMYPSIQPHTHAPFHPNVQPWFRLRIQLSACPSIHLAIDQGAHQSSNPPVSSQPAVYPCIFPSSHPTKPPSIQPSACAS